MNENGNPLQHYFETHGLPYLLEHVRMRAIGLQLFTAIQGGLLFAWLRKEHWALLILGLTSAACFWLWDSRNRFVIQWLRGWGKTYVDSQLPSTVSEPFEGINYRFEKEITARPMKSHTRAIDLAIGVAVAVWGILALPYIGSLIQGPALSVQEGLQITAIRGSESWQFFAFFFSAVVVLFYGLIDHLVGRERLIKVSENVKAVIKVLVFGVTGYFVLLHPGVRNWLVWVLNEFIKKEPH